MLIRIKNKSEEINKVNDKVKKFCEKNEISLDKSHDIALILDEIITNVVNYAYPDGKEHEFTLDIEKKGEKHLCIKLIDDGEPFDPLMKSDPIFDLPIETRPVGGLGIFM